MTEQNVELPREWFEGVTARSSGPQLTEATLEDACSKIAEFQRGYGFAYRAWRLYFAPEALFVATAGVEPESREAYFRAEFAKLQRPPLVPQQRMRKEIAPLFEGDKLIGQMVVFRPFNATNYLPFIERIHPDDEAKIRELIDLGELVSPPAGARIQRFNLHKGRYVLEGTET